jgi:hypothetical protein
MERVKFLPLQNVLPVLKLRSNGLKYPRTHLDKRKNMLKKSLATLFVSALLASTSLATFAQAATIVNGTNCAKAGATTTIKVKGVSKVYSCRINPLAPMASITTWTLKTCVTYLATAKNSQDSINQQRSLVQAMSEPDKSTYTKQLDASQASLDKVIAAIKTNHCKAGL